MCVCARVRLCVDRGQNGKKSNAPFDCALKSGHSLALLHVGVRDLPASAAGS